MAKHHDILGPATNLLGVSLIIIAGLHVTHASAATIADEIAWLAAVALSASCLTAYLAIRADPQPTRYEEIADKAFLAGMTLLFLAVVILAVGSA